MTAKTRIMLEQSALRETINRLLGLAEMTEEQRGELTVATERGTALEGELRAALIAEPEVTITDNGDTEARELEALTGRADMGNIFTAVIEHRQTDGAELELQTHFNMGANQIPLSMLAEERAVTPAPTNVQGNQAEIIPGVFPQSCAAFLSIDSPTVATGDAIYPVLTTNADAGTPAENNEQAESTGAFTAELLSPSRIQASFFYSREDRARFVGMGEALRSNLSEALADKLDQQILDGPKGLLNGTVLPNHNVSTQTTYALYRHQFAFGRVDGTYASTTDELRIVMGSETFTHAAAQYRGNNDNQDALQSLREATGGVKVSAHVPDLASTKQNAVIRLGNRRDYVAPIWNGVTLIPDEITQAKAGQVVITAVMLYQVQLLRADGFHKQQIQNA